MTAGHKTPLGFIKPAMVTWAREKEGLNSTALARRAHISPSYLSKIESGLKNPSPAVALRIANALGIPLQGIYELNPDSGIELYVLEVPRAS